MAHSPDLVTRCEKMPPEALLALYREGLAQKEPGPCELSARAIRQQARAGTFPDTYLPVLVACYQDAPTLEAGHHLAKALAAFGRAAGMAAPYLIDHIRGLHITDDRTFWVLDGTLHALSYIGDGRTVAFTNELAEQSPLLVSASKSVYRGKLSDEEREAIFFDTLETIADRFESDDPGVWRNKVTSLAPTDDDDGKEGLKPWMTR